MATRIIHEAGKLVIDPETKAFRVCLIEEGSGSTADFPRSFFVQENADRYAGSLSFANHPPDPENPSTRDPLTAIGRIGDKVTIEEHDGKLSLWSDFIPAQSKPDVAPYIAEFGHKLGLSVFGQSDGHDDPVSGKWIAESVPDHDPYRSVDLVVAAGRGGKFEKVVAESLRLLAEASASAEENEESNMEKIEEVARDLGALKTIVEALVTKIDGKAKADAQIEVDTAAVEKAVAESLANYDKAVALISEAKLTESQSEELRALAMKGEDIAPKVEVAKKVLAEALASVKNGEDDAEVHLGGSKQIAESAKGFAVAGFGEVR